MRINKNSSQRKKKYLLYGKGLKDLDSKSINLPFSSSSSFLLEPSAYWEKVETQTQLPRNTHSTYVYNDKMYAFGGSDGSVKVQQMWCLDLSII